MTPFARSAVASVAILAAALALERAHPSRRPTFVPAWLPPIVRDLAHHGPNEEDELGLLSGYYEELLNASNEATRRHDPEEGWRGSIRLDETHERVQGYLWYRPRPGLDLVTAAGTRVVTNSHGLADREYALAPPEGVRRIAFVGDSLVRGLGTPFGRALEPRLEEWLNETQTGGSLRGFEVLNFGVEGYRLTQLLRVALESAPRFEPHVVLLGLSDLSVTRNFGNHLARLVHEGIDVEYPFLRELVARAGLRRDDEIDEAESKLARVRVELVRACLREMRDRLGERGIALVAVLLPTVTEPERIAARFAEVRGLLDELAIPTVDLLDTFADVGDLDPVRVGRVDHHPNERGYGMLLARMQERLAAQPELARLVIGRAAR